MSEADSRLSVLSKETERKIQLPKALALCRNILVQTKSEFGNCSAYPHLSDVLQPFTILRIFTLNHQENTRFSSFLSASFFFKWLFSLDKAQRLQNSLSYFSFFFH